MQTERFHCKELVKITKNAIFVPRHSYPIQNSFRAEAGVTGGGGRPAANIEKFPLEARGETVSREALVQAALHEITQNYREASLSNVARSYGVSLAYVSECVRAQTGKTYKELLQKHRMETAARLLRRSDWNIQQIITYVGYENTSYFYRLFHERYGVSPREYRRSRTPRVRASA